MLMRADRPVEPKMDARDRRRPQLLQARQARQPVAGSLGEKAPHAVEWHGVVQKVIVPAALSPIIAGAVATLGTHLVYRTTRGVPDGVRTSGFRISQIGSAAMVSLAHGTNDAQKTMGVITLALIANHSIPSDSQAPMWVIV